MKEACYMIRKTDERIKTNDPILEGFRDMYTGEILRSIAEAYVKLYAIPSELVRLTDVYITHMEMISEEDELVIDTLDGRIIYKIVEGEISMPDLD